MRRCFTVCVLRVLPIPTNLGTAVQLYSHGMAGIHILLDMNSSSKSAYSNMQVFTVSWISFSTGIFETAADDLIFWILKQCLLQGRMSSTATATVKTLVQWLYENIGTALPPWQFFLKQSALVLDTCWGSVEFLCWSRFHLPFIIQIEVWKEKKRLLCKSLVLIT